MKYIKYIYCGEIRLTDKNVIDVYDVSDMFLYDQIKEQSLSYIYSNINENNCVKYWLFANQRNIQGLVTICKSTITHMIDKIPTDDIVNIPFDTFLEIIKDDNLGCKNEANVLIIVLNWIENHHPKISCTQKQSLRKEIRWGLIHQKDLPQIENLLATEIMSTIHTHTNANPNEKILLEIKYSDYFKMRGEKTKVKVMGIHTNENKIVWKFVNNFLMVKPIGYGAVVKVGNHIVVTGGKDDTLSKNITPTFAFDMKNNCWDHLAPMNIPRYQHIAVAFDKYILVAGGCDQDGNYLNSVEIYDIAENRWKIMKPFLKAKYLKGCCYFGDVYVCGGVIQESSYVFDNNCGIYKYNFKYDKWIEICKIPDLEYGIGAICEYKEKIYMCQYGNPHFIVFDPIFLTLNKEIYDPTINVLYANDVIVPVIYVEKQN